MFIVEGSENPGDLTHEQLWRGLVQKAEDPVPFVRAITHCEVLERGESHLVREIVLRGERVRELVTFEAPNVVRFVRLSGRVAGTIENRISDRPDGDVELQFTFHLEAKGIPHGSRAESEFAERMRASYLEAIHSTIERTRSWYSGKAS